MMNVAVPMSQFGIAPFFARRKCAAGAIATHGSVVVKPAGGGTPSSGGVPGGGSGAVGGISSNPAGARAGAASAGAASQAGAGSGGSGSARASGYRVGLFRQAVQNGKNLTFVGSLDSASGHSGISDSITDQAIANYHSNIVLLMIGTNDINGNVDVAAAPTRLGQLIDDITTRAPNALLVVATIIPIAKTRPRFPSIRTIELH